MIIIYEPEGGERRTWNLKEVRFLASEAEAVERATGMDWQEAKARVVKGSMLALRAVVWVLVKRDQPTLRYGQFDPAEGEVGTDLDASEWAVLREEMLKSSDLSEDQRAELLAEIDAELAKAEKAPDDTESDELPKDSDGQASLTAA